MYACAAHAWYTAIAAAPRRFARGHFRIDITLYTIASSTCTCPPTFTSRTLTRPRSTVNQLQINLKLIMHMALIITLMHKLVCNLPRVRRNAQCMHMHIYAYMRRRLSLMITTRTRARSHGTTYVRLYNYTYIRVTAMVSRARPVALASVYKAPRLRVSIYGRTYTRMHVRIPPPRLHAQAGKAHGRGHTWHKTHNACMHMRVRNCLASCSCCH